jgi:hypothetical protein
MSVLLIEKDPFIDGGSEPYTSALHKNTNVRRPLYGITLKENRFAYLSVFQDGYASGRGLVPVSLKDSSAPDGKSQANHNFILTSVQDARQEKAQIIETFGDHYVFLYGQKPIVLQCSGFLMNTADFNWKNEFLHNYETYLRGTKAAENRTRVFLGWDDVLAQGWMMNVSVGYNAEMPYLCPVQFSILLSAPPTDLSSATSLVDKSSDARTLGGQFGEAVEYHGAIEPQYIYEIDPLTGESMSVQNPAAFWPTTLDNPQGSPYGTPITDTVRKQWADEKAAIDKMKIAAQDAKIAALVAALEKKNALTDAVTASSGTGVVNTATPIPNTGASTTDGDFGETEENFDDLYGDYDFSDPFGESDGYDGFYGESEV